MTSDYDVIVVGSGHNGLTTAAYLAKAGKVKLLAVLESKRFPRIPDVPTVGETLPGFEKPASWFGFFGPAGLSQALANRFQAESARAFNVPEIRDRLEEMGLVVIASTPSEFAALIKRGFEVYGKAAKAADIKPE